MQERRITARLAAVIVALLMVAVPAAASVITENFMRGDVAGGAACFVKLAGPDAAATADADVDVTSTIVSATTGVTLLQETITVAGYAGDRVTYTDVVRYRNTCDYAVTLTLVAEDDPAGGTAISGTWADKYAAVYLSTTAGAGAPVGVAPDWSATFIEVSGGALTGPTAGSVTVPIGAEVQSAFVIETDAGTATTGTLRYTAQAVSS